MTRPAGAAAVAGVLVGLLLVPVAVLRPAAAAQLVVTAVPIQTWTSTDLPALPDGPADLSACGDLADYDQIVSGTGGDDVLEAGNGRQILVGLAGDDLLRGGNHDDCLLGGDGDDRLEGGNGRDLLFGQQGADALDGGTGKDLLDAGGDNGDTCTTNGAPDVVVGCETPQTSDLVDSGTPTPASEDPEGSSDDASDPSEPAQEVPEVPDAESSAAPAEEPTEEPAEHPSTVPSDLASPGTTLRS